MAVHHSWNPLELPLIIRRQFKPVAMTWFCRKCEVQNSQQFEKCRSCKKHWSEVWEPSKKKVRSRSKSRKKAKGVTSEEKTDESWQVFPSRVPWIQSTPARMASSRLEVNSDVKEGDVQLPPQPILPPPPPVPLEMQEESLTADETKILEHLRGLQSAGVTLSESMEKQLQVLLQREHKTQAAKILTHGHINRLHKLKSQVSGSAKRIKELDAEWGAFVTRTLTKIKEHGVMYQSYRADMLEQYNQKLSELHAMKKEVSAASQSLVGQPNEEEPMLDAPDLDTSFEMLQTALAESSAIDLTEEPMEEDEMIADPPESKGEEAKKESLAMKPFRSAASPTGVAKAHLKSKEKEKPGKETKYRDEK